MVDRGEGKSQLVGQWSSRAVKVFWDEHLERCDVTVIHLHILIQQVMVEIITNINLGGMHLQVTYYFTNKPASIP